MLLNIDAGELPDEPDEFYSLAHIVNIACGGHVGDETSMRRAVRLAQARGAAVGAHPSYDDREGFGRRALDVSRKTLRSWIVAQCELLAKIASDEGAALRYVKPHGALYHEVSKDGEAATTFVDAVVSALGGEVAFLGDRRGELRALCDRTGRRFLGEAFADRGVRPDGSLIPRGEPGALISDPLLAAARATELLDAPGIATVCVHGDMPGALEIARFVRKVLDSEIS